MTIRVRYFFAAVLVLFAGCGSAKPGQGTTIWQKIESGIKTVVSDVQTIDRYGAKIAPAVTAIAETLVPGSAVAVDLSRASTILTKSEGAIQSFTLTYPPQPSGTLQVVEATSDIAAQMAPQITAIAEAAAPGSSADAILSKASVKIGTINGILQHLIVTVPAK